MISLCTVIIHNENQKNDIFEPVFIESVIKKLDLVSELLICKINAKNDFYTECNIAGKKIIKFGYKNNFFYDHPKYEIPYYNFDNLINDHNKEEVENIKNQTLIQLNRTKDGKIDSVVYNKSLHLGHPLGMRYAIEKANNDLVLLCDPDIFFYSDIDKFYNNLMLQYNLDYIGACPHLSYLYSTKYFPNILCMLTKKSSLPSPDFIKDQIISQDIICGLGKISLQNYWHDPEFLNDEYLVGAKIKSLAPQFPNPDGIFDTGVYLWLWAQQNKQTWLGFQPYDIHLYTSQIYRTNLKIKDRISIHKLFYHATGGCRHLYFDDFMDEYKKSKKEEEE